MAAPEVSAAEAPGSCSAPVSGRDALLGRVGSCGWRSSGLGDRGVTVAIWAVSLLFPGERRDEGLLQFPERERKRVLVAAATARAASPATQHSGSPASSAA